MSDKVREKYIIQSIGSINNCNNLNLFILGFHHAIFCLRKQNFETVCIDNISNNISEKKMPIDNPVDNPINPIKLLDYSGSFVSVASFLATFIGPITMLRI